tara:strand:+ start:1027 stop:1524 length:498 start_codon:yes stop_codon:yes gene_type:complete
MATPTYEPIATTTLGTATNSYTFTSISGSYTDLVLVVRGQFASGTDYPVYQFNSDTTNSYSETTLRGEGTTAQSSRAANRAFTTTNSYGATTSQPFMFYSHIMNYSNTHSYKTLLTRWSNSAVEVAALVGLWRKTNAITSIKVYGLTGNTFAVGSTFTLYGIKAA